MNYKEWQEVYLPIKELRIDSIVGKRRTKIFEELTNHYEANVWTIVMRDAFEGIVPGKKFVDAIGFIITKELHEFEDIFIQLNENKEMQNVMKEATNEINSLTTTIKSEVIGIDENLLKWLQECPVKIVNSTHEHTKGKDSLDMIKEFMILFSQPHYEIPTIPNKDVMVLRAKLSLEELYERTQASGIEGSFAILLTNIIIKIFKDQPIVNLMLKPLIIHIKEQLDTLDTDRVDLNLVLDALLDERYVNDGAIHAYGMEDKFREYFPKLQHSNMSKPCKDEQEAKDTCEFHKAEYGECYYVERNGKWFVYEKATNKAMKSINYIKLKIEL